MISYQLYNVISPYLTTDQTYYLLTCTNKCLEHTDVILMCMNN